MSDRAFAFFDVDETLLSFKTMFSFQRYFASHYFAGPTPWRRLRRACLSAEFDLYRRGGVAREYINRRYYSYFRGWAVSEVEDAAREWYAQERRRLDFFHDVVLDALQSHQRNGVTAVLVSGSSQEILAPLAVELGLEHVLATRLVRSKGRFTGELIPPQTIGKGKGQAIEAFLRERGGDPARSFAYGDHESDLPMLEIVGNPIVVAHAGKMRMVASQRAWPILDPAPAIP
jgi:HAD superfamily hydrolase (TIGR01490 family)